MLDKQQRSKKQKQLETIHSGRILGVHSIAGTAILILIPVLIIWRIRGIILSTIGMPISLMLIIGSITFIVLLIITLSLTCSAMLNRHQIDLSRAIYKQSTDNVKKVINNFVNI